MAQTSDDGICKYFWINPCTQHFKRTPYPDKCQSALTNFENLNLISSTSHEVIIRLI
jgi:hypothetical protein